MSILEAIGLRRVLNPTQEELAEEKQVTVRPDKPEVLGGNPEGNAMTPDKCDHMEGTITTAIHRDGECLACWGCGLRFVPSGVLEEARAAMKQALQDHFDHAYGFESDEMMRAALVRIDGVLGK